MLREEITKAYDGAEPEEDAPDASDLKPQERQEMAQVQQYLRSFVGRFDELPEGSIGAVLNATSPRVRAVLLSNRDVAQHVIESGGRIAPFQDKVNIRDRLGAEDRQVLDRAHDEEIIHGLHQRMGTPGVNRG